MKDAFISYARKEQEWAKAIARVLDKNGLSVWWDKRELLCGDEFDAEIQKAIENSKGVIVLWSKLSVKSDYVNKEANLANHLKKLLPVIISNITDKDLPEQFRGIHTISLRKWRGSSRSQHVRNLVNAIKKLLPAGVAKETFEGERSRATSSSIAIGPVAIKNIPRQSAVDQERKSGRRIKQLTR